MPGGNKIDRMKVLVTGASGFVGKALCRHLLDNNLEVCGVARGTAPFSRPRFTWATRAIDECAEWSDLLSDVQVIVHLAARVHVMRDHASDPLTEFRRVNVYGSTNIARQAIACGIKRFIFVSSIKVNGEYTESGKTFCADDKPAPLDAYGISKYEAEIALRELAATSTMELVIVRPPLVYGPGVKANFQRMMSWLARGIPLPFGGVRHNRRSLVAAENLVDLLTLCLKHPAAAGEVFLVSDGEDLSTAELLERLGNAMGRPARLLNVPPTLLRIVTHLLGQKVLKTRILGSLQVDIGKTRRLLGWTPPLQIDEALAIAWGNKKNTEN